MTIVLSVEVIVFPAHAGVIPTYQMQQLAEARFSRTRGGDPNDRGYRIRLWMFFPHTRG